MYGVLLKKCWPNYITIIFSSLILLVGCTTVSTTGDSGQDESEEKIKVYTTIYPIYEFAQAVGGNKVQVVNLIPPGQDPHHWEPTPSVIAGMRNADMFIYNGVGMEAWLGKVIKNYPRMVAVDTSAGTDLITAQDHDEDSHGGCKYSHHKDDGIVYDPHIWLDPLNAIQQVNNILQALIEIDPDNGDYYAANADEYRSELHKLHVEYQKTLENTRLNKFVVSHASFGYLANRYGLEQISVRGVFAEAEPGPGTMKEIVDLARKYDIKYVFYEPLISSRVTEVIAREVNIDTLCLHPLEVLTEEEMQAGKTYLSVMRENLINLNLALR